MMRLETVLLVDDDRPTLRAWTRLFSTRGCRVQAAETLGAARVAMRARAPDLALLDLSLGTECGLDLVPELRALDEKTIIVLASGHSELRVREAYRLGADQVLCKPVPVGKMLDWIERGGPHPDTPTLSRAMAEHRLEVVAACGGSIRRAAKVLGMTRPALQRQLDWPIPHTPPPKKQSRTLRSGASPPS